MSITTIPSVAKGAAPDIMAEEQALGMWTTAQNVVFRSDFLQRCDGNGELVAAPSVSPYYLQPFSDGTNLGLIHVGLQSAFIDIAGVRTDISRAAPYTGTAANRWTGGAFKGLSIINNGVDKPGYWSGLVANDFTDLTGWNANWRARALRPHGDFLFAMGITDTGVLRPSRVIWSSPAETGTLPSWDIADPAEDAADADVPGTGTLVDGLSLGDVFVLYKTSSTSLARYVGGENVFSVKEIPGGLGLLAAGCAADTPAGHVCLTTGDVVLHQGGMPRSIASALVRNTIFTELSKTYYSRAFVAANPSQSEVWVCYPTSGSTCARAAIWNWITGAWTFRSLRNVTHGAAGQMPAARGTPWSEAVGAWSAQTGTWGGSALAPNDQKLALAHTIPAITTVGNGQTDAGVSITSLVERTGIALNDGQRRKVLRHWWPRIEAAAGTQFLLTAGAADLPNKPPTWGVERTYTQGADEKVSPFVTGRYLALRIRTTADTPWRMRSMDLDIEPLGTH